MFDCGMYLGRSSYTPRLWWWLMCLAPTALMGQSNTQWTLASNPMCLLDRNSCATFYPSDGSEKIEQSSWRPTVLPIPGQVCINRGKLSLELVSVEAQGPIPWYRYLASGGCYFLGKQEIEFYGSGTIAGESTEERRQHVGAALRNNTPIQPSPTIGQPPFVAQPEGTLWQVIMAADGRSCLTVKDGLVTVRPRRQEQGPSVSLGPDNALCLRPSNMLNKDWKVLMGAEAQSTVKEISKKGRIRIQSGSTDVSEIVQQHFEAVISALRQPELEPALNAVHVLHDAAPGELLTQQALATVALKAHRLRRTADVAALRQLLATAAPDSQWLEVLDSEVASDDQHAQQ